MIKDGKEIVLTKEVAIEWHQKMWNWIADQYKAGPTEGVYNLKSEYCDKNNIEYLMNQCFCCDYSINYSSEDYEPKCEKCPVKWGTEDYRHGYYCESSNSLYSMLSALAVNGRPIDNTNIAEELARKIANLPVKEQG